jgi:hypothetical protein
LHVWSDAQKSTMESIRNSIKSLLKGTLDLLGSFVEFCFTSTTKVSNVSQPNLHVLPPPSVQMDFDHVILKAKELFDCFSDSEFYPKKPIVEDE